MQKLPSSLREALELLSQDENVVRVIGEEMKRLYLTMKKEELE